MLSNHSAASFNFTKMQIFLGVRFSFVMDTRFTTNQNCFLFRLISKMLDLGKHLPARVDIFPHDKTPLLLVSISGICFELPHPKVEICRRNSRADDRSKHKALFRPIILIVQQSSTPNSVSWIMLLFCVPPLRQTSN